MDETKELLKAGVERLEGLVGEVKDLRYKIRDVQGDIDSLRSAMRQQQNQQQGQQQNQPQNQQQGQQPAQQQGQQPAQQQGQQPAQQQGQQPAQQQGGGNTDQRLTTIEDRLDYLTQKFVQIDQEIHKLRQQKN